MAIKEPKVAASGLMDVAMLGLSKSVTERLLTPVVGNATLTSGAAKLIGGGVVQSMLKGKMGAALGGGMVVDGIEDIVTSVLGGSVGGNSGDSGAW